MVGKLTPDNQMSASRIPQLMNASPYGTPNELLDEFLQRDAGTYVDEFVENDAMYLGNRGRANAALRESRQRLGMTGVQTEITVPHQHKDLALAASLDGEGKGKRPDQSRSRSQDLPAAGGDAR